jgi:hypothetical protein
MSRIALAPCSPFSVTTELLRDTIKFARERGVICHTHLCETKDEEAYCLQTHGLRPLEYMESVDWVGPDVWYAHGIFFNDAEIDRLARTQTGIAHCPTSNLRLGSGICPVPHMLEKGVRVGIGVDGSASNDSSNFLKEIQLALLVHRVGTGVESMPAERVLRMATVGGAEILGRPEVGRMRPAWRLTWPCSIWSASNLPEPWLTPRRPRCSVDPARVRNTPLWLEKSWWKKDTWWAWTKRGCSIGPTKLRSACWPRRSGRRDETIVNHGETRMSQCAAVVGEIRYENV